MFKHISSRLNKDEQLLKHSLVIFIGSIVAGILNYAYQLMMGRILGPADYGVLGALFSIIYFATFSFGAIRTIAMGFTSGHNDYGKMNSFLWLCLRKLAFYGLIGLVLFSLASPFVAEFLNIPLSLVLLTGIFLFLSLLAPVPMGILNGLENYTSLTVMSVLFSVVKLALGFLSVFLGYGLFGAMVALDAAQLISLALPFIILIPLLGKKKSEIGSTDFFSYSIPVFIGIAVMNLFVNIDVILVKHYFPAVEAGYYAAASIVGKVIWFGTSALLVAMFPKVVSSKNPERILKSVLFYTLLISSTAILLYFFIPSFISSVLFGSDYKIAQYVGIFGLALGIFSVSNILVTYNLALKKTSFAFWLIPLLAVEIFGIIFFHSTLLEVIQVVLVTNVLLCAFMVFSARKELGCNGAV